jgi:flagellar basal body-associated protein FliL
MATGETKKKSTLILLVVIIVIAVAAVVWQAVRATKKAEVPVAPFDIGGKSKGMKSKGAAMETPAPGGSAPTR